MTFSEFVKVMYPFCNEKLQGDKETSRARFLVHLTNQIMSGQPGRSRKKTEDKNGAETEEKKKLAYQNPLANKGKRFLYDCFNGDKSISKEDASTIFSSISPEKFEKYIAKRCNIDALVEIHDRLSAIENVDSLGEKYVPKLCAKIFKEIISNLAES